MSEREFTRAAVLRRVISGEISIMEATPLLGVSCRQAKRLRARYRTRGRAGLVHASLGRRSNRRTPETYRDQVLGFWALFTTLMASAHSVDPMHAAMAALRMIVPAAALGLVVQRFIERHPWPGRVRLSFVVVHHLAAAA